MHTSMTPEIMPSPSSQQRAETQAKAAEAFLLEWADMTPAEQLRAQYLASHDLTEEQLEIMKEQERQKIEDEIKEFIKQKLAGIFETGKEAYEEPAKRLASQIALQGLGLKSL